MDDFVHDSFSVEKLRKTYSGVFNPMTSKYFWPRVDLGYKIKKHKLRRKPGGPRKTRIKASDEPGARKRKVLRMPSTWPYNKEVPRGPDC